MLRVAIRLIPILLLSGSALAQPVPVPANPGGPPPGFYDPGPPPPRYYPPPPDYYRPPPPPRLTCFVYERYGGGTCRAPRYARPGDRCGCQMPFGYVPGRAG